MAVRVSEKKTVIFVNLPDGRLESWHCTDQWQSLTGEYVEVCLDGRHYRFGFVEDTMADGSGLWLGADGVDGREYIDVLAGFKIWTSLYPRSPLESPKT